LRSLLQIRAGDFDQLTVWTLGTSCGGVDFYVHIDGEDRIDLDDRFVGTTCTLADGSIAHLLVGGVDVFETDPLRDAVFRFLSNNEACNLAPRIAGKIAILESQKKIAGILCKKASDVFPFYVDISAAVVGETVFLSGHIDGVRGSTRARV
jgi:hypothetical protein